MRKAVQTPVLEKGASSQIEALGGGTPPNVGAGLSDP